MASPEALAPATSRPAPQRFGPPSPHSRRPFSGTVRFPQALGGGVSDPSPYSQPCPARLSPIRFGPARPSPRHSRLRQLRRLLPCPGFSPTHSRPKQRRRIRAARGLAGRNTWGLCSRNRKLPFPPPLCRAGAVLGSRRFGSLFPARVEPPCSLVPRAKNLGPDRFCPYAGISVQLGAFSLHAYLLQGFSFRFSVIDLCLV